jgi:ATP-dependent RNA helicase DDX55/SPB4
MDLCCSISKLADSSRELALQIYSVLTALLAFHQQSAAALAAEGHVGPEARIVLPQLVIGGSQSVAQDMANFLERSPNVLIGTPGRLLEILSSSHVHCPQSSFEVLILDEADRLLDLGFKDELQKIIGLLPKQRRTGLFSASMSDGVDQIIRVGLRNRSSTTPHSKISQLTPDERCV